MLSSREPHALYTLGPGLRGQRVSERPGDSLCTWRQRWDPITSLSSTPTPTPPSSLGEEPADREAGGVQHEAGPGREPVLTAALHLPAQHPNQPRAPRANCGDQQAVLPGCGLWFLFGFD